MIHYQQGDLLNSPCKYICHQVNCRGEMGAGVAAQIAQRWPQVYQEYRKLYEAYIWDRLFPSPLGTVQLVPINEHQFVANLFAQEDYGRDQRYTSYDAFWECLNWLHGITGPTDKIAFPYGIGCGLGGGNWHIILKMIEIALHDREVFIYIKE